MSVPPRVSCFVPAAVACFLLAGSPVRAGSFMEEPGHWLAIATSAVTTSVSAYDDRGARKAADPYRKVESSLWMEYGASPDMTLVFHPTAASARLTTTGGTLSADGLSSIEAGARFRLGAIRTWTVSFQTLVSAPARSDPAFLDENRPHTEFRLGAGSPARINGTSGFLDSSIAFVRRTGNWPDEIKLESTYGWRRRENEMMLLQYFLSAFPEQGLRHAPRAHKVQTSVVYKLKRDYALQIGSFASRGGNLTRREQGSFVALWRRF